MRELPAEEGAMRVSGRTAAERWDSPPVDGRTERVPPLYVLPVDGRRAGVPLPLYTLPPEGTRAP